MPESKRIVRKSEYAARRNVTSDRMTRSFLAVLQVSKRVRKVFPDLTDTDELVIAILVREALIKDLKRLVKISWNEGCEMRMNSGTLIDRRVDDAQPAERLDIPLARLAPSMNDLARFPAPSATQELYLRSLRDSAVGTFLANAPRRALMASPCVPDGFEGLMALQSERLRIAIAATDASRGELLKIDRKFP